MNCQNVTHFHSSHKKHSGYEASFCKQAYESLRKSLNTSYIIDNFDLKNIHLKLTKSKIIKALLYLLLF